VGGKHKTFTCRALQAAGGVTAAGAVPAAVTACLITAANRKKCQACRFSKCRAMGMTHTSMENNKGGSMQQRVSPGGRYVKPAPACSPLSTAIMSEDVGLGGYFYSTGDLLDQQPLFYDYTDPGPSLPLSCPPSLVQDESDSSPYTVYSTGQAPEFSYTILSTESLSSSSLPAPELVYPLDTPDLEPLPSLIPPLECDTADRLPPALDFTRPPSSGYPLTPDLPLSDPPPYYSSESTDTSFSPLPNINSFSMQTGLGFQHNSDFVPTIRLLYSDPLDPQKAMLEQLETADLKSVLGWQDIRRIIGDDVYDPQPSQIGEQIAGAILMDEQVTMKIFSVLRYIVMEKINKFVEYVPELYQLTKAELQLLLDMNKDKIFIFQLVIIFNTNFTSLQDQVECLGLLNFSEFDESGSFSLAPALTSNLFSDVFSKVFPGMSQMRVDELLNYSCNVGQDRKVAAIIILLLLVELNMQGKQMMASAFQFNDDILDDLDSRLKTIKLRLESCLKTYFYNVYGSFEQIYDQSMTSIQVCGELAEIFRITDFLDF